MFKLVSLHFSFLFIYRLTETIILHTCSRKPLLKFLPFITHRSTISNIFLNNTETGPQSLKTNWITNEATFTATGLKNEYTNVFILKLYFFQWIPIDFFFNKTYIFFGLPSFQLLFYSAFLIFLILKLFLRIIRAFEIY